MVEGCEIKETGGCYCACKASDDIEYLKDIKNERSIKIKNGIIYFPYENDLINYIKNMPQEEREEYFAYLKEIDQKIKKAEENLRKYESK